MPHTIRGRGGRVAFSAPSADSPNPKPLPNRPGLPEGAQPVYLPHFVDLGEDLPENLRKILPPPWVNHAGHLHFWGFATRAECVVHYPDIPVLPQSIYRPASVVFEEEALASYHGAPLTSDHPTPEEEYTVTPANTRRYTIGSIVEPGIPVEVEGEHLVMVHCVMHDPAAIHAFYDGKHSLSTGELCWILAEEGEADGEAYDGVMLAYHINHLAQCFDPRLGPLSRARTHTAPAPATPSADADTSTEQTTSTHTEPDMFEDENGNTGNMDDENNDDANTGNMDGEDTDETPNGGDDMEALKKENADLKAENSRLQAQVDELKASASANAAPKGITEAQAKAREQAAANKHVEVYRKALRVNGGKDVVKTPNSDKPVHLSALPSGREMLSAALNSLYPNEDFSQKDDLYLEVRVDEILARTARADAAEDELSAASNAARNNAAPKDSSRQAIEDKAAATRKARIDKMQGKAA